MTQQLELPKPGESVALSGGMLIGLRNGRGLYVTKDELENDEEWANVLKVMQEEKRGT